MNKKTKYTCLSMAIRTEPFLAIKNGPLCAKKSYLAHLISQSIAFTSHYKNV